MNRVRCCVLIVLCSQFTSTAMFAQRTDVVEAPNFLGKNVCMLVKRPSIPGANFSELPFPSVQMETELDHRQADYPRGAKYTIVIGTLGTIFIEEELATDSTCGNLPLDAFAWRDEADGVHSKANFCLSGADGKRKVHVQGSATASNASLTSLKSTLVQIAPCRMTLYPSQYDSRDVYSNKAPLLVGPGAYAK
jgi:hypothetical protein